MSNFTNEAFHPIKRVTLQALWVDDYFGPHKYAVFFPDDPTPYKAEDCIVPKDKEPKREQDQG